MWWFIAIVALILLVVSAGFRKFALAIVVIAVIGGFIIHQNSKREEQLSRQRISLHQLIFENVNLKNTNYGDFNLTGRIHNESKQYTLTDVGLNLTFRDCIKGKDCIIIGETTEHIYRNIRTKSAIFKKVFIHP